MKRLLAFTITLLTLMTILASCSSQEKIVFEYEGYTVTASQYNYWVSNYKTQILKYHGARDTKEFWESEMSEGVTMEAFYTPIIDGVVKNYCIAQSLYRKYGLAISSDTKKAIRNDINEKIEYYGSRAQVNEALAPMNINISGLQEIYTIQEKYKTLYNHLFSSTGTMAPTAKEVQDYYEENYYRMKYIVFETYEPVLDANGKPKYDSSGALITKKCSEEELNRLRSVMETVKNKAGLGDEATFDQLIKEYSAYDLSGYKNGLWVSANEATAYGTKILQALTELEPGQCAIVEEEEYLFLVRKYELIPFDSLEESDITAQLANLQAYTAQQISAAMFAELHDAVVVHEDVKASLSLSKVAANTDPNF